MPSDIYSLDDLPDSFWSPPLDTAAPPDMNRSQSEWALERFLEEMSSACVEPPAVNHAAAPASGPTVSQSSSSNNIERKRDEGIEIATAHHQRPFVDHTVSIDSEHYHAYLKSQLDLACAAVALTRTSSGMAENSADSTENQEKGLQSGCQSDSKVTADALSWVANEGNSVQVEIPAPPARQKNTGTNEADSGQLGIPSLPARQRQICASEADSGPVGIPALPASQKKAGAQGMQTISESSREDSDDDEVDGDNELPDNMDPSESKRARRMLSNRESARRSRRRKQEQMNELETQVGQLKVEHSTLLKRLSDINHKCDGAAVDNRVLKADIETLRAKVKMAEETVKRVTGLNPLLLAMSKAPSFNLPYAGRSVMDASVNTSRQLQQSHNQLPQQPLSSVSAAVQDRVKGAFNNISSTTMANPSNDVARNRAAGMPPMHSVADTQNHILRDERTTGLPAVWQPDMSNVGPKEK